MLSIDFSPLEWYLAGVSAALFFILLFYCLWFYARPFRRSSIQKTIGQELVDMPPVSVILYLQDNVRAFEQHLVAFLTQEYPKYEVIVVTDGVPEEWINLLSEQKKQYPHLYFTSIPKEARFISKKKLALMLGEKAAHHERMFFSDLTVEPMGPHWLQAMMQTLPADRPMVLGLTSYPHADSLKNRLLGVDHLRYTLQFASAALMGHPYNGTGKNLSYTKKLFFANKGFSNQLYLKTGEDSLFINEVASSENTSVCCHPDGLIQQREPYSFKAWTLDRIVRRSMNSMYPHKLYRVFKLEGVFYFLYLAATIVAICMGLLSHWVLALFVVLLWLLYYGVKTAVFVQRSKLLQQRTAWYSFAFLDMVDYFYLAYIEFAGRYGKRRNHVFVLDK